MNSKLLAKATRYTIMKIAQKASWWHYGWSLSCIDYLSVLYFNHISKTWEKIVISNWHISSWIYALLAELGWINKKELINWYRKFWSLFEWHVNKKILWIDFSTGSLGCGVSVAAWMALAWKLQSWNKKNEKFIYAIMWDGEAQEWQVFEMINFASKHKLDNLILFVDENKVQLSGSLQEIIPINISLIFKTANWNVFNCDWHNHEELKKTIGESKALKNYKPTVIIGSTILWKWITCMEEEGKQLKSTWHWKLPSQKQIKNELKLLKLTLKEKKQLNKWKKKIQIPLKILENQNNIGKNNISSLLLPVGKSKACRIMYWETLKYLSINNKKIITLTADVSSSVKTDEVKKIWTNQYIECWIAEQNMVSIAGWMSVSNIIPFCSTFSVFLSSRARDQIRLNDINQTNVKMVATHSWISVWEDWPTHQCIDDISIISPLRNTKILEPADPNQTVHIINFITNTRWNFYVRMWRHSLPIIKWKKWNAYFNKDYKFEYWKSDIISRGTNLTIISCGSCVTECITAKEQIRKLNINISLEIIAISSLTQVDEKIITSLKKTKNCIVVEDHNIIGWIWSIIANYIVENNISLKYFKKLWITEYQNSGSQQKLYKNCWIDCEGIVKSILNFLKIKK